MSYTEILAPVGGEESLIAAVRAGADAVYFGADKFNARRNAENFSDDGLKKAIEYCRLNGVKSYLTLNTLIKDDELESALSLVNKVWLYGIDAIILQDIGLAALIHKNFPLLHLHASTQLSIHSPAALPILKKMGFCRVVVAREMSRNELADFCKAAKELDIEVEYFVHGALCMCLSGQCYFSAYLGGRSANRGLCAGTCRLPFKAKGGTGYDLSLKDLSLISYLEDLSFIGVTSFKIEGRMKRPEYVACAVHAARQAVDKGNIDPEIHRLLTQVFSRDGFTDGYYTENLGPSMFGVRSEQDKKLSADAMSRIHGLYRWERQKIPLVISFLLKKDQPCSLTVTCDGITVRVEGETGQRAINRPLTKERVAETFSKLGGTCYYASNITAECDEGLMLPISVLNGIKKEALSQLDQKRLLLNRGQAVPITLSDNNLQKRCITGFYARFATVEQCLASAPLLQKLKGYSLPSGALLKALNEPSYNKAQKDILTGAEVELPRGAANDSATESVLIKLKEGGISKVVCSNLSAVFLADKIGLKITGGFGLNLFNSDSLSWVGKLSIQRAVLSTELNFGEIKKLSPPDGTELLSFCYGRQPLMLTRNCPVKNGVGCKGKKDYCLITDRKNQSFPVVCLNGFCEILNCKTTNISDCLDNLSVDIGYLYFTLEKPETVTGVISDFLNRKAQTGDEFTRGLFKSGVL